MLGRILSSEHGTNVIVVGIYAYLLPVAARSPHHRVIYPCESSSPVRGGLHSLSHDSTTEICPAYNLWSAIAGAPDFPCVLVVTPHERPAGVISAGSGQQHPMFANVCCTRTSFSVSVPVPFTIPISLPVTLP